MYFMTSSLNRSAGIAQLVEHNLAMVRVASSNLVSRSRLKSPLMNLLIKSFSYVKSVVLQINSNKVYFY